LFLLALLYQLALANLGHHQNLELRQVPEFHLVLVCLAVLVFLLVLEYRSDPGRHPVLVLQTVPGPR
jgi:hypothetical protein